MAKTRGLGDASSPAYCNNPAASKCLGESKIGDGRHLSRKIPPTIGLKQGCVLAPLLFNLYISDLSEALDEVSSHAPSLRNQTVSNLLYADDLLLLAQTPIGLQRMLTRLASYTAENRLEINLKKTKVIPFQKRLSSTCRWWLDGKRVDEVSSYRYLGVILDSRASFKLHKESMSGKSSALSFAFAALVKKVNSPNMNHILEVMKHKLLPTIAYGSEIMLEGISSYIETLRIRSYKRVMQVPKSSSPAQLRLEFGLPKQYLVGQGSFTKFCSKSGMQMMTP